MADLRQTTLQRTCNCGNTPQNSYNNMPFVGGNYGYNSYVPPIMPPVISSTGNNTTPSNVTYESLADFPAEGASGVFYIDNASHKVYYWDGTQYISIAGNSSSGEGGSGEGCDDCCIWGDIISGGDADPSDDGECPFPHGSCGGGGSVSVTTESILEALGYVPASAGQLETEIKAREDADKAEAILREKTDKEESKAREKADSEETRARKNADIVEARARETADLALKNELNSINTKAIEAKTAAENAQTASDAAKEMAREAKHFANQAENQAIVAQTLLGTLKEGVEKATQDAAEAKTAIDKVVEDNTSAITDVENKINNIETLATDTKTDAEIAKNAALEAKDIAKASQEDIARAAAIADEAKTTADDMTKLAKSADKHAETAQKLAEVAEDEADEAKEIAQAAKETADIAKQTADEAKKAIEEMSQSAIDDIKAEVAKAVQEAKTAAKEATDAVATIKSDVANATKAANEAKTSASAATMLAAEAKATANDLQNKVNESLSEAQAAAAKAEVAMDSLKNINDELKGAKETIANLRDTVDEALGSQTDWEWLGSISPKQEVPEIIVDIEHLAQCECRKVYVSVAINGSDSNNTTERMAIRCNVDDDNHRIATLNNAVPATSQSTRYTNLYAHILPTKRLSGYIQGINAAPDANVILQSLATRSAKNVEIDFGTTIKSLYFRVEDDGVFGANTKIDIYGVKQ